MYQMPKSICLVGVLLLCSCNSARIESGSKGWEAENSNRSMICEISKISLANIASANVFLAPNDRFRIISGDYEINAISQFHSYLIANGQRFALVNAGTTLPNGYEPEIIQPQISGQFARAEEEAALDAMIDSSVGYIPHVLGLAMDSSLDDLTKMKMRALAEKWASGETITFTGRSQLYSISVKITANQKTRDELLQRLGKRMPVKKSSGLSRREEYPKIACCTAGLSCDHIELRQQRRDE